jgi:hypothetical protein
MAKIDLDAIERRKFAALPDDMAALIGEVRRLREENDAVIARLGEFEGPEANEPEQVNAALNVAREVARLRCQGHVALEVADGSDLVHFNEACDALDRLAALWPPTNEPHTPEMYDPWTLHGEAQATLRADDEREERR